MWFKRRFVFDRCHLALQPFALGPVVFGMISAEKEAVGAGEVGPIPLPLEGERAEAFGGDGEGDVAADGSGSGNGMNADDGEVMDREPGAAADSLAMGAGDGAVVDARIFDLGVVYGV